MLFKVGDKVRVISGVYSGETGVIIAVQSGDVPYRVKIHETPNWFFEHRVVLANPTSDQKRAYAHYCIAFAHDHRGDTATISPKPIAPGFVGKRIDWAIGGEVMITGKADARGVEVTKGNVTCFMPAEWLSDPVNNARKAYAEKVKQFCIDNPEGTRVKVIKKVLPDGYHNSFTTEMEGRIGTVLEVMPRADRGHSGVLLSDDKCYPVEALEVVKDTPQDWRRGLKVGDTVRTMRKSSSKCCAFAHPVGFTATIRLFDDDDYSICIENDVDWWWAYPADVEKVDDAKPTDTHDGYKAVANAWWRANPNGTRVKIVKAEVGKGYKNNFSEMKYNGDIGVVAEFLGNVEDGILVKLDSGMATCFPFEWLQPIKEEVKPNSYRFTAKLMDIDYLRVWRENPGAVGIFVDHGDGRGVVLVRDYTIWGFSVFSCTREEAERRTKEAKEKYAASAKRRFTVTVL